MKSCSDFNMFHLLCINLIHNIQISNKMNSSVYDVLYSQCSHQHVSAAIMTIFSVMLLLQQYKVQMRLAVSLSLHNN